MTSNCLEVLVLVLVLVVVALATPRSPHTLPLVKSITSGNGVTAPETGPGQKQSKLIAKTDKKMGEITLKSRASTVKYPVFFKKMECQIYGETGARLADKLTDNMAKKLSEKLADKLDNNR